MKRTPATTTAIARPVSGQSAQSEPAFLLLAQQVITLKRSPRTREAYTEDLQRWLTFCAALGATPERPPLLAVTTFRDHLIASFATSSVRRILAALSSIYGGLRRIPGSGIALNPFTPETLPWPQAPQGGGTAAVAEGDAEAMIALCEEEGRLVAREEGPSPCDGLRDAAILRLLYDLGLRRASVAGLLRNNVRKEGKRTLIRVVVKGGKEEEVSLPDITVTALRRWLELCEQKSPYVFPASRGGSHLHPNILNRILSERAEQAGVGHVHPHAFRAAFVTAGYDAGLAERDIQESVHHADPKVTRHYDRGARGLTVATTVADERAARRKGRA